MLATNLFRTAIGWALAATLAHAQSPVISDADIENVRRAQPTITDADIERARQAHRAPPDTRLDSAPNPVGPRIEALPVPLAPTPIDLEALARGYASQADPSAALAPLAAGPTLFIFVSLSMPTPTLMRLIDQAERTGASILIRGLQNGSLRETAARIQALIGSRQISVQIDPQAFARFAITHVPSFVLVRGQARSVPCAHGTCASPEDFLRTSGDVSLDYALDHMHASAPGLTGEIGPFLDRLRR